jgi:hypothetical protein
LLSIAGSFKHATCTTSSVGVVVSRSKDEPDMKISRIRLSDKTGNGRQSAESSEMTIT